jgi:hypothetical protein
MSRWIPRFEDQVDLQFQGELGWLKCWISVIQDSPCVINGEIRRGGVGDDRLNCDWDPGGKLNEATQ